MLSNKSLVRIWTKLTIAVIAALKQRNILRDLIGCGFLVETGKFEDLFFKREASSVSVPIY